MNSEEKTNPETAPSVQNEVESHQETPTSGVQEVVERHEDEGGLLGNAGAGDSHSSHLRRIAIGSQRDVAAARAAKVAKPLAVAKAELNPVDLGSGKSVPETPEPPAIRSRWGLGGDEDAELEAALGGASLDSLMQNTEVASSELEAGERVKGIVNRITQENIFFTLKGTHEGVIATRQFKSLPEEGAMIDVIVKAENADDGLWDLLLPGASVDAGDWESIQVGDVVDCRVTGSNTGGLEATVNQLRGFIPASQIDRVRVETFGDYVNQKLQCVVQEVNPQKKRLVLSRRAVLDREFEEKRKELMGKIEPGQTLEGLVTRLADFGAFVDVGGIEGLVHISKLSWSRVKHPSEIVKVGEKVKVKVEKVESANGKVSLSLRDTVEHPWEGVEDRFPVNSIVPGRVTRLAQFGAFVQLSPGVEGLVHISELAHHRVFAVKNVVKEGDEVQVKVLAIDREKQKISLSLKATQAPPEKPSDKKQEEEADLPDRPLAVAKRNEPLQGGRGRSSGGEKFGLNL